MSRVYCDDSMDFGQYALWEGNATRAIEGRKGQKFLREVERALVEMPVPRLIAGSFSLEGEVCLLGACAVQRCVDAGLDRQVALAYVEDHWGGERDEDAACVGKRSLGLTYVLAWELTYLNDGHPELDPCPGTPEERWARCLAWVRERIIG